MARVYYVSVFTDHGLPRIIISARDSKFTSNSWQPLWKLTCTRLALSTTVSPQTDGQTERRNKTLEEMLRAYVSHTQVDWESWSVSAEFAYNNTPNTALGGKNPFEIDMGCKPTDPLHMFTAAARDCCKQNMIVNIVEDFINQQRLNLVTTQRALKLAQYNQKLQYNTKHRNVE